LAHEHLCPRPLSHPTCLPHRAGKRNAKELVLEQLRHGGGGGRAGLHIRGPLPTLKHCSPGVVILETWLQKNHAQEAPSYVGFQKGKSAASCCPRCCFGVVSEGPADCWGLLFIMGGVIFIRGGPACCAPDSMFSLPGPAWGPATCNERTVHAAWGGPAQEVEGSGGHASCTAHT
jgi:hypothetical protein